MNTRLFATVIKASFFSVFVGLTTACVPPVCTDALINAGRIPGVDCIANNNLPPSQPITPPPTIAPVPSTPTSSGVPATNTNTQPEVIASGDDIGIYGLIKDSVNKSPLSGVQILINDACLTKSCTQPITLSTQTNQAGVFGNNQASQKMLSTFSTNESVKISISKPGYKTVTKYYLPNYGANGLANLGSIQLCPESSVDTDADTICDSAEETYGTNSMLVDTDADAISDTAEIYGVSGLDLTAYRANPLRKNIFLEMDYYTGRELSTSNLDMLRQAFLDAPLQNVDGSMGIILYIDYDDRIDSSEMTEADLEREYFKDVSANDASYTATWAIFDERIKSKYFNPQRQGIFHYGLRMNSLPEYSFGGLSRGIVADDFITNNANISTIMHELGHNLGLYHGGTRTGRNYAPHYFSVMNYLYTYGYYTTSNDYAVLDYSRIAVKSFSEDNFNEEQGFDAATADKEEALGSYRVKIYSLNRVLNGKASANVDLNFNQSIETAAKTDVDGNSLTVNWSDTQNDWVNLRYSGKRFSGDQYLAHAAATNSGVSARSKSFSSVSNNHEFEEPCPPERH